MKISYNWLRSYIDIDISVSETAQVLTSIGLEVEAQESFESIPGSLAGLIVGEVISCVPHPQADKLSLTRVNTGAPELLPIVCGAPNVAAGQKVIVAPVGCILNIGKERITIKKTRIRGEESLGMICAEDEIGLGDDHTGIVILDPAATVGSPVAGLYEIETDHIFEIGLTPNRIDSASHFGVARELKAALNADRNSFLKRPSPVLPAQTANLEIAVDIINHEACTRYSGICLTDVKVEDSPLWLKNRLQSIGMKPINNVVDITNFVLHETGQPLHAFDASQIKGKRIIVQTVSEGTGFVTLDEQERKLSSDDLMICNEDHPMCIAGVFGGLDSGVTAGTTSLFLESACFNPVRIRKTSKRHQIYTDSSFRFERGTDPNGTLFALERAAAMICEIAGAKVASPVIDVYPIPVLPYPVELKWSNLDRLIGIRIDHDEVRKILKSLDIEILQENENSIQLAIATYRVDVRREADVIEEILRIYGYNNVGLSEQVNSTLSYSPKPDPDKLENLISDQLAAQGFSEMMANSLSPAIYYEKMPLYPETTGVKLLNPLSNDLNYLRRTLLFGALEAVSLNLKYKNNDLRLFEFGNTYSLVEGKNTLLADSYHETRYLAILVTGKNHPEHWSSKVRDSGFYDLKSVVLGVLSRLGISEPDLTLTEGADQRYVLGITGSIGKAECLQMGLIHPDLLESMEIEQPVWFAEINWDVLLKMVKTSLKAQELAKYPIVRRDLALVLDSSVRYQEIRSLAFVVERKLLKEVSVFDVYTSDKLGEGKKSLAVSFYLQDENQTLTDKQIEQVMRKLISAFEDKLGAVLR